MSKELTVVVSGSFNSLTLPRIQETVSWFKKIGYTVLAPLFQDIHGLDTSFPFLDTDDMKKSPRELEQAFLAKIGRAALHVTISHPDGRVGRSSAAEFAHAAIHDTANAVITPTAHGSDAPKIWFTNDLSKAERSTLETLPRIHIDLMHSAMADIELRTYIEKAHHLSIDPAERQILVGICAK
jgi:hypothetical protein